MNLFGKILGLHDNFNYKKRIIYLDETYEIENEFKVHVPNIHEMLLGYFQIIFYKQFFFYEKIIGFSEIRTKDIKNEMSIKIIDPKYLHHYQCYNQNGIIGEYKINFIKETIEEEFGIEQGITKKVFGLFQLPERAYSLKRKIDELFKGSLSCKLNGLQGLFLLEKLEKRLQEQQYEILKNKNIKSNAMSNNSSSFSDILNSCIGLDGVEISDLSVELSNGYELKDIRFYKKYLKIFRYSISTYNSKFLALFRIKKIKESKVEDEARKTVLDFTGINDEDLISVNLHRSFPHVIFKTDNRLVLSFRGTETPTDALNDLDCDYEKFLSGYAHKGIKKLAEKFLKENLGEIKELMKFHNLEEILLTGQSMGGGIAVIVSVILYNTEDIKFKTVVFSPPPVLSENLAKKYKNIKIFVLGDDIVPRLSYGSVVDLKYLCSSLGNSRELIKRNNTSEISAYVSDIKKYMRENNLHPKLYHPGKIYHFNLYKKDKQTSIFQKINIFTEEGTLLLVKNVEKEYFDEIIVKKSFFIHHTISTMFKGLTKTVKVMENKNKK